MFGIGGFLIYGGLMAEFKKAFEKTMAHEGGYVNDPDDAGGETYRGISRVYNPRWYGWSLIDQEKNKFDFPLCLEHNKELNKSVEDFYKDRYWDINRLDDFPQIIAEEMFDTGVNMGITKAAKFFQTALNYLNKNGHLFVELVVDGKIGPKTLNGLQRIQDGKDLDVLMIMLNTLQGQHYFKIMDKNPIQKKYARGWFRRVKF
jgi:lysozyme family protein